MNEQRRKELRRLCEGATPGPWVRHARAFACVDSERRVIANAGAYSSNVDPEEAIEANENNADFIAAARSAVPDLLEENDRLLEALREIVADDEYTGTRTGHGDRGPAYADTARAALETDHE